MADTLTSTASEEVAVAKPEKKVSGRRVIFASAFGNALEFFDFGVYNFFVVYIGVLFFPPTSDPNIGLLLAFATFGVSFFMRPLGGILIGAYADRFGRKPAMVLTISLMSLGTLLIGIAPTYASAGYWGTITLVLARLIQGVAAGGEVGASMSMLVESAPANRRGFYSSWALATQGLATTFGGLVALSLSAYLPVITNSPDVMSEWGWRVPFFIGVALAPIGCWLRLSLENDMPHPKAAKTQAAVVRESAVKLLGQHIRVIIIGILLTIGSTVATYISLYYYGTYAAKYLKMDQNYAYAAMLLAGILTFIGGLLVGILSDHVGRKKLVMISRTVILLLAYPSFWLLVNYPEPAVLLSVVFVMVCFTTLGAVPVMLVISELLPKRIRALGFALVYSIGVAIFGGFAQFFATQSIVWLDSLTAPAWYLGGATLLSMLALPFFKDPKRLEE
ncbi:MFS transporter [Limnobaculum zhutongyuii]|uniref:MFS transporter n=1 Tax=Limnobaculum zhutongyuii TaxID=2498113 RepID=A0A411WQU0_9GAMM|nr:MFS transporter [Limnobaculum zhutongyuii]QBH98599.1 MFS transporter [Limnobaculum zhutongyuii]TQS86881.1 MFS transporter [Limnobaculum zhutongyuii]